MALLTLSPSLSAYAPKTSLLCPPSTSYNSSTSSSSSGTPSLLPPLKCSMKIRAIKSTRGRRRSWIVGMAPEEEKMTRRSPLDFPIEWDRPKPGRRPDIFPQFSPMKTPLPPPMPADPPEEDEEEEEEKKEEEEENPEENPDKPDQ
ncbi:hypothetical protein DH2020_013270 [Rehmannia glutinosa]|uniref:Uncharacterized protein n=1 Tax=Rehmannia glutinosa TaxID=99300 RepID=A0ABR0X4B9_REHGL